MKLKICRSDSRTGFTLLEAVMAMVIVTLAAVATLSTLMFNRAHSSEEQERARAHQIVCERMDTVLHELFPKAESGEEVQVWDNGTPGDTTDDTNGLLSVVLRDVSGDEISTTPTPWERVQVEVTLTWSPRGRRGNVELRESVMSFMAPHG